MVTAEPSQSEHRKQKTRIAQICAGRGQSPRAIGEERQAVACSPSIKCSDGAQTEPRRCSD
eukprot:11207726-Prorocentrum_lima.AAC.1